MHILVADDDSQLRELLAEFLRDRGHTVDTAADGREAIECLRGGSYQVAFLDFVMPGTSGMDVLRQVRGTIPQTACVMMTGHTSVDTAVEAIKSGASEFVAKPLDTEAIDRVLESVRRRTLQPGLEAGEGETPSEEAGDQVRAAFLTDRSGILIASRVLPQERTVDHDLFGATLEVIQDFMRTSFPGLRGGHLKSIHQGNRTLVIEPGEQAMLTVLVQGGETENLHHEMRKALRDFEEQNRGRLRNGIVVSDQLQGADDALARIMGRRR